MKWELQYAFKFDAAHRLWDMPEGHPCARLHGHTWKGVLYLQTDKLNSQNFVIDFAKVKDIVQYKVIEMFDHQFLNDHVTFSPTCELLAQALFCRVTEHLQDYYPDTNVKLTKIKIEETKGHSVTYGNV